MPVTHVLAGRCDIHRLANLFLIGVLAGCATDPERSVMQQKDDVQNYSCHQILVEMNLRAKAQGPGNRASARETLGGLSGGFDLESDFPDPRNKHRIPELGSHRDNELRDLWYEKRCSE